MIRIPTRTHSIVDLAYSATFLAAPFILKAFNERNKGKSNGKRSKKNNSKSKNSYKENLTLPAMGGGILAQGLMTNHELGAVKAINMPVHLTMDLALGALMIGSPWLFNLDERAKIPMVVLGAAQIGLALLTQTEPGYEQLESVLDDPDTFMEDISRIL